jgi:hypothetical protein
VLSTYDFGGKTVKEPPKVLLSPKNFTPVEGDLFAYVSDFSRSAQTISLLPQSCQ